MNQIPVLESESEEEREIVDDGFLSYDDRLDEEPDDPCIKLNKEDKERKFAKMCVELDLTKPLISKIHIGKHWQKVKYEGLIILCFHCDKFGHSDLDCNVQKKEKQGYYEKQALRFPELEKILSKEYKNKRFGPWMFAKKKYNKSMAAKQEGSMKASAMISNKGSTKSNVKGKNVQEDIVKIAYSKNVGNEKWDKMSNNGKVLKDVSNIVSKPLHILKNKGIEGIRDISNKMSRPLVTLENNGNENAFIEP
ncbi:hypothetical protein REPUB_Repub06bG0152500 [Reevesia pubescens]